jgi:hypothetical protein
LEQEAAPIGELQKTFMSNTYIKFKSSTSLVKKVPENIGKRLAKTLLTSTIPIANPDFENKIEKVAFWLIEFENDSYYPNREIGLDSFEKPIVIMPWGKNYGYWTDNDLVIENFRSHFETVDISKEVFEKYWNLFVRES